MWCSKKCIFCCQGSIAIGVYINVDICWSSTIIYQIENQLSEHAVQSYCIIHSKGYIAIGVPMNFDTYCSSTVQHLIENL